MWVSLIHSHPVPYLHLQIRWTARCVLQMYSCIGPYRQVKRCLPQGKGNGFLSKFWTSNRTKERHISEDGRPANVTFPLVTISVMPQEKMWPTASHFTSKHNDFTWEAKESLAFCQLPIIFQMSITVSILSLVQCVVNRKFLFKIW